MGGVGLSRAGHTLNFGFRPLAPFRGWSYEQVVSTRLRT
jgi:hypothetical protein